MDQSNDKKDEHTAQTTQSKRKRTPGRNSSSEDSSDPDEGEYTLFTKYFADGEKSKTRTKTEPKSTAKSTEKGSINRKRKFLYKAESVAPKKCRRFYFINDLMTKPRKPKVIKPVEVQEKKQECVTGKKHKMHFARVDAHGNAYLMHRLHIKSDLFFNDEKTYSDEPFKKLDLSFHVVDEIALEGLDGITLEAFWKRLKNVFPNSINKTMADRIWRMICNNKRINFYILKEPREELVFFDRCKYLDTDSGMFVEPFIEIKDIYPLASVNGTEIRGSCSTFNTRKENNGVRKFSMEKAIKLYDQKLVFVADQTLRNKALINEETDPNIEIMDVEYCMLEKIGRSRDQGEVTQGKMSLVNDNKKVYHNRKALMQNFLIAHQSFCLKSLALQQNISGGLVHLSRFYSRRKTKQIVIMERIANLLKTKPNYQIELTDFRKIFGRNVSIVKLLKTPEFRSFFKICACPYRKLYPNASKYEYLHKSNHKEKQIKVLRMLDPCANVTAIMDAKDTKEVLQQKSIDVPGHKFMNYEYLRDIFHYILSTGRIGVTIQEIHNYFKMDFYSVRLAVRKLMLRNVITSHKIDLGRQQSLKFFAKCFSDPSCHIETQPGNYQLSDETLSIVLKGYANISKNDSVRFYSAPETPVQVDPVQTEFTLDFEPFGCTAFLTEIVDANSEELTIYDIVIKGRDKLLLIESNLFAHYISEWDDFLLKRDDYSKGIELFHNGFGKVIYDFLTAVKINENIEVDNCIVFSIGNVTPETRIGRQFHEHRIIKVSKNFCNPHSDTCYVDAVSKIYLLEAMFNVSHRPNQSVQKLKNVFERFMMFEGKKKRESDDFVKLEPKIELEVSSNVVMEKFMGDEPVLEWSGEEEGIKIEIFVSTKPPVPFVEPGTMFTTNDINLTQRYVSRANSILKDVYDQKVVKDVRTLFKNVRREEDEEGYDTKVCKKSIVSIVSKLVTEGYIRIFKVVMNGHNMTRTQCFICVPNANAQDTFIKSTIEQMKLKFYVGSAHSQKTIKIKKKIESPFSSTDVKDSIVELKQLTSAKMEPEYKFNRERGKMYGFTPKFVRLRVLHEHLFYVIRELTETQQLTKRQVFELCKSLKIKLSQNDITEMPPIYCNEVSWKMFIPALPQNPNRPKGWALACDIILRMPLSVFVKLYNVTYEISELEMYLNHPVKRHLLLKYLPVNIRNILFYRRRYFHSIYEIFCHLCYVGLLQLGPRNFKEKDQVFIYLNSKSTLYDTCTSKPGYNRIEDKKYKKIPFDFKSGNDVEVYWSEMLRICMNTQLGKRKILDGQCVTIEDCNSKPAMIETLKAKTFNDVIETDNGKVPGDRRGGAGLDSSLWTFVKRNWVWSSQLENKAPTSIQSQVTGLKKEKFDVTLPQPIQYDLLAKGGAPERKVYLKPAKPLKPIKKPNVKSIVIKKSKKKFVRKIIAPRTKRVREYYDAVDKAIMKSNPTMRVEWDEEEDQLLRYCRAASVFLCPEFKKQFIPYNIIRDVLHRIYPKSKNKTSRAVQRRIYVLLTNDEAIRNMEKNIENFLNSDTIAKYFDQIHNRYKYDIKISDSQMYISFIYLMSHIYKHRKEVELLLLGYFATVDFFSEFNISDFETLVQNCENGSSSEIYTNPKSVEDITKDTIKSVVHCSMACKKNSVGWTFHLSRIYRKFQDELIRTAVASLKRDQFFVINKNYEGKSLDNNWPTPLKFSHVYNLTKTSTYTIEMFREAFRTFAAMMQQIDSEISNFMVCNELYSFWERICLIFEIPEMGIILNPEVDDHSEVIEELAKRFRLYLDKIYVKKNGTKNRDRDVLTCDTKQDASHRREKDIEEIKSSVRHLIFRVPYPLEGNLEMCFKKMLDSSSNLEISNYIFLMILDLKKFALDNNTVADLKTFIDNIEDESSTVESSQKLMTSLSKVVFAIQNIHQQQQVSTSSESLKSFEDAFSSWETEIWDEVTTTNSEEAGLVNSGLKSRFNKNHPSGMESCIKRAQDGDFPSLEEIKEGMMVEIEEAENRNIPHITDLIVFLNEGRFPELDTDNDTIEKMKEHFIMQYPKLHQFVIEDLEEMKEHAVTKQITDDCKMNRVKAVTENIVKPPQLDQIVRYIRDLNGTEEDIKTTEKLIDYIKNKKELGVPATELKTTFAPETGLDLAKLLQFLSEIGVILRAGVTSIIYVHHEYQSDWLTETFMITALEKEEAFPSKEKQGMKKLKTLFGEKLESAERKVQLKPWTKLDGSLNHELFHEWLCIVLSRCVDLPNIPFLVLCEQFHYIKPVDIYCLVEVLQELGCVEAHLFSRVENDLFSRRCIVDECKATCLDSFEEMFVRTTHVSGLCFGSYLNGDVELITY